MEKISIIGVDCATEKKKVAIGYGIFSGDKPILKKVVISEGKEEPVDVICKLVKKVKPVLFAFDAPLGWPKEMAHILTEHKAGEPIYVDANSLFNRETELFIKKVIGKKPLEIGADRIARTTKWTLDLIDALRKKLGYDIPISWDHNEILPASVIEVYPAATLLSRNINIKGYKSKNNSESRIQILKKLESYIKIDEDKKKIIETSHKLDAVICVLAASDYLRGDCIPPPEELSVEKEGWIWIR
jgi:predicted nuclease with RNAse H fold